jgi:hypothetical protein
MLQDLMKEHLIYKMYVDLYEKLDLSYMEALARSVEILKETIHNISNEDH